MTFTMNPARRPPRLSILNMITGVVAIPVAVLGLLFFAQSLIR
jgi:hypothetical protein